MLCPTDLADKGYVIQLSINVISARRFCFRTRQVILSFIIAKLYGFQLAGDAPEAQ